MLTLPQPFIDEMIAHALEDAPIECCGIIAGENGHAVKLFRARNADESKWRYTVDSRDLFRIFRECDDKGWDFLAIYHSHTASDAYPSPTDVRLAYWPDAYYVLVSVAGRDNPIVRAFRILDGRITEEDLHAG